MLVYNQRGVICVSCSAGQVTMTSEDLQVVNQEKTTNYYLRRDRTGSAMRNINNTEIINR